MSPDIDVDLDNLEFDDAISPTERLKPGVSTIANIRVNKVRNGFTLVFLSTAPSIKTGRSIVEAIYVAKEFSEIPDLLTAHVVGNKL